MIADVFALALAGGAPDVLPSISRTALSLLAVLAIIGGLAWLLRRGVLRPKAAAGLRIETSLPLGDRRSLMIVTVEGRRLLLGMGPAHVSLVTELQEPASFEQAMAAAGQPGVRS
jgi:flagellar biosynthetic protein FliO